MKNLIKRYKFEGTDLYDLECQLKEQIYNIDKVRDKATISKNTFIETDYLDYLREQVSKDYEYSKKVLNDDYEDTLNVIKVNNFVDMFNQKGNQQEWYELYDKEQDEYWYHYELKQAYVRTICGYDHLDKGEQIFFKKFEVINLDVVKLCDSEGGEYSQSICHIKDKQTNKEYVCTDLTLLQVHLHYDSNDFRISERKELIKHSEFVKVCGDFFSLPLESIQNLSD